MATITGIVTGVSRATGQPGYKQLAISVALGGAAGQGQAINQTISVPDADVAAEQIDIDAVIEITIRRVS